MNEKPGYYAIISADVRYHEKLSDGAKLLYGEITALSNKNGYCWASNDYFSRLYSVSISTIKRRLQALEELGFIKRIVKYKEGTTEVEKRFISITPEVKNEPRWGQNCTGGGVKNEPENNTSINNTTTTLGEPELINFWEKNGFGFISPKNRADLMYWVDDFKKIGSTDEQAVQVVKQAMSNAIDNNVRRYSYVNAILKNWESLRLTSLEAVTAYEAQRTQRQKSKSTSRQASTDVYHNQGDVQDEDLPW
ncbi:DnaD domain protein [Lacticaseibacillus paracasei]|uniref:DnaD domain protein n=1 Tax=Lacticaseibacillus paracasei TaxID=1597 RepID=UPI0021A6E42C|nr:DnaD domain protein [Lacticaseibacillus paracasei]MCT3319322.1 DnaD domain protein [Lacticaseibacillus paracasei]